MFQVPGSCSEFMFGVLSSSFEVLASALLVRGLGSGFLVRFLVQVAQSRVSEILCVGHSMRRLYAPQIDSEEGAG
jgi:hypothetical protein